MLGRAGRGLCSSLSASKTVFVRSQKNDLSSGSSSCRRRGKCLSCPMWSSQGNRCLRLKGLSPATCCFLELSLAPKCWTLRPSLFIPSGALGLRVVLPRHRYTALEFERRERERGAATISCSILHVSGAGSGTCKGTLGHMRPLSWIDSIWAIQLRIITNIAQTVPSMWDQLAFRANQQQVDSHGLSFFPRLCWL